MIKVSETFFNKVKKLAEAGDTYKLSKKFPDEFGVSSNRLDHIEINEKSVIFHDRGLVISSGTFDMTFGCYIE